MKRNKKLLATILIGLLFTLGPATEAQSQMVIIDAIKLATKKVIRAIDLQIQRLQNKTIDLQNIQKEIENKLSKLKLDEISEWTKRQKEIYQEYFDELWRVKSAIAYYKRITEIVSKQKQLVSEYKHAYSLLKRDQHFSASEIDYIYTVYSGIIAESIKNLDQILMLVQSFTVQMSDADRLQMLNRAAEQIEEQISDLRAFTNQNIQISLQRARDLNELEMIKKLYGLPE